MSKILNWIFFIVVLALAAHYIYKLPRFKEGNIAPDFTAQSLDNTIFKLSDRAPSKYTLLSFWGSWCAPCRRKNKEIFELSKKYDISALQIVTLPIEKNEQAMKNAIVVDSLTKLQHLPQLEYFGSDIARLYGVREIPTTYLLDQKNNVVGVNLKYTEIVQFLSAK